MGWGEKIWSSHSAVVVFWSVLPFSVRPIRGRQDGARRRELVLKLFVRHDRAADRGDRETDVGQRLERERRVGCEPGRGKEKKKTRRRRGTAETGQTDKGENEQGALGRK